MQEHLKEDITTPLFKINKNGLNLMMIMYHKLTLKKQKTNLMEVNKKILMDS